MFNDDSNQYLNPEEPPQFHSGLEDETEVISRRVNTGNIVRYVGIAVFVIFGILILYRMSIFEKKLDAINQDTTHIMHNTVTTNDDLIDVRRALEELGCTGSSGTATTEDDWDFDIPSEDKPVIYVYDPQERDVNVELHFAEGYFDDFTLWPKPGSFIATSSLGAGFEWSVKASKDGILTDEHGNEYSYIFWEAPAYNDYSFHLDIDQGFCVSGDQTGEFLQEKLSEIGLNSREANDFITYWLPDMQNNPYNLIKFIGIDPDDQYNKDFPLRVHDARDSDNVAESQLRVLMVWQPSDVMVNLDPQTFTGFERNGLTVVEWGGIQLGDTDIEINNE